MSLQVSAPPSAPRFTLVISGSRASLRAAASQSAADMLLRSALFAPESSTVPPGSVTV